MSYSTEKCNSNYFWNFGTFVPNRTKNNFEMSRYVSQFGEEGVKTYKNYLAVISHVSSMCKEITIRMS